MLQRALLRRSFRPSSEACKFSTPCRTVVTIPAHSRDTIRSRDPNRPLPPLPTSAFRKWATTLPIFVLLIGVSAAAIFNYQKSSSSPVNSTLYALRTNPEVRKVLGDEIYFRDKIPWVWGECNAVKGRIDIGFAVKGTKETGYMRFRSTRHGGRMGKVCLCVYLPVMLMCLVCYGRMESRTG